MTSFLNLLIQVIGLCNLVYGSFGFFPFFSRESKQEDIELSNKELKRIKDLREDSEQLKRENRKLIDKMIPEATASCRNFRQLFENSKVHNYHEKKLFLESHGDIYNYNCKNPMPEISELFPDEDAEAKIQFESDLEKEMYRYNLENEKSKYLIQSYGKMSYAATWYEQNIKKDKK